MIMADPNSRVKVLGFVHNWQSKIPCNISNNLSILRKRYHHHHKTLPPHIYQNNNKLLMLRSEINLTTIKIIMKIIKNQCTRTSFDLGLWGTTLNIALSILYPSITPSICIASAFVSVVRNLKITKGSNSKTCFNRFYLSRNMFLPFSSC